MTNVAAFTATVTGVLVAAAGLVHAASQAFWALVGG